PVVVDPHDPHAVEVGGLPLSVMVGLALLPFAIPLVWLIAPLVVGRPPALSVATPVALAVAAAALCLAVVFTVDWSPATRLKGVLVLLGLTYLAGLSLYFLRKEMVDRVGAQFGPRWREFRPPQGPPYAVELPGKPVPTNEQPLAAALFCHRAGHAGWAGDFLCLVGAGDDPHPDEADDPWFAAVAREVAGRDKGRPIPGAVIPGREWRVGLGGAARTVRVYRANGAVYYLAAEGPDPDGHAARVFASFKPGP
ncbi:MAG: hypothetical protein K2X87_32535, partial [Gemmataceae bacterium]|nr:hypothetical protein [Gemmataceae bacterium]